ncbi:hypothetical protein ACLI1A_04770 [Flavobacterium sp. RHBU_3]|uniref:hypothetical protein n=1 Tax=Flavobacterium sp. RHBU_3 TaxID=3391184 RepID=UPI003984CAAE
MKVLFLGICLLFSVLLSAQVPQLELKPNGFDPVTVTLPPANTKKLIALTKSWVSEHRRSSEVVEVSNITDNSLIITVYKQHAFYYRERGEAFYQNIKMLMKVEFRNESFNLAVSVPEIYSEEGRLLKYHIPDYFTSEGNMKDGYDGLKESLELTVNRIAGNYYNFLVNYR